MMTPSVTSLVHYVSHGSPHRADGTQAFTPACRAAVVTEIGVDTENDADTLIGLCVLNPTGLYFHSLATGGSTYDGGHGAAGWSCTGRDHPGGTWHWPALQVDRPVVTPPRRPVTHKPSR